MLSSATSWNIDQPPSSFEDVVAWFAWVSDRLVLLDELSREQIAAAVATIDRAVRAHLSHVDRAPRGPPPIPARLADEHRRFLASLEQLAWLLAIVERDDHGGNRQALGQYGRLLTEALRRHRLEEAPAPTRRTAPARRPPRNRN